MPPVITASTADQVFDYGESGIVPAPAYTQGTGDNPTWSMPVDNFGSKAGVLTWTIDATTGDITYEINRISTVAAEQQLNMNGPYSVTRRITTTAGFDEETFDIGVNVGDETILLVDFFTSGFMTYRTKTIAYRGIEVGKDPSPSRTVTYTVT